MDVSSTPDLSVAYEQLDRYALTKNPISDLLYFRNIGKRDLEKAGSLHKIPPVAKLQAYLFGQYLYLLAGQRNATLVFIGSGDAVLEIYVALHALENFAIMGHRFGKFRVILSDTDYRDKPKDAAIEFIFSLAQSVFPELQWEWNTDILNVFPQLQESDNYTNTIFLAFNLSMPSWIPRGTQQLINPRAQFVQRLPTRFKEARFISCSSINPDRSSKKLGIWVRSDSLKNFDAENRPDATNVEDDPFLQSCIQCRSEIHGVAWIEPQNSERIFCGRMCQKAFWTV